MIQIPLIFAPTRSFNSAVSGGDGGRLCVMGDGCNDAAELGREGKSCFYSCSGCFEFGNVDRKQQGQLGRTTFRGVRANLRARRRNADSKGGVSALVSGLSKSFQRMRIEEEIDNIHSMDAIMVERRIVVEREQELRMVVADGFERREFAGERGFVADSVRHLEVAGASAFNKLFAEKLEKRGFPATTNASHDFDDIVVAPACEPVGKPFSADFATAAPVIALRFAAWRVKF